MKKKAVNDNYDALIIGAGISGLYAAIKLHDNLTTKRNKANIAIITKVHPLRSNSIIDSNGINAVLNPKDNLKFFQYDTIKAGDFLSDQDKVDELTKASKNIVEDLEKMGLIFYKNKENKIDQRPYGGKAFLTQKDYSGATYPRICYTSDHTGKDILYFLYGAALRRNIEIKELFVADLITNESQCVGVTTYDIKTGDIKSLHSYATILATGGIGAMYKNTTNSQINTADGIMMAHRAGADLMDVEFVSFHPTTLINSNLEIDAGFRGEGAVLLNRRNERFMSKYSKKRMDEASDIIIARAIQNEIDHKRGIDEENYVYLDLSTMQTKLVNNLVKKIVPENQKLKVHPSQDLFLGGIKTDINGRTSLKGLYAVGECACSGVHGAYYLEGNGILEALFASQKASENILDFIRDTDNIKAMPDENDENKFRNYFNSFMENNQGTSWGKIKNQLKNIMTGNVGIFKDKKDLEKALKEIRSLKSNFNKIGIKDKSKVFNTELIEVLQLKNMLDLADLMIVSSIVRDESRGSHFRKEHSERRDIKFLKHLVIHPDKKLELKDISLGNIRPEKMRY